MFDTGVVHIDVIGDIVDHYCFMFDQQHHQPQQNEPLLCQT
jgi:hypothetical protein